MIYPKPETPMLALPAFRQAALLIALAGAPDTNTTPIDLCQAVAGSIDARANRLGLDLRGFKATGGGSITGGLVGTLRVEVRRIGRRGPVTELTIALTASTPAGPIELEGQAFAQRERPEDAFHRVTGWLDVPAGAGAPAGRTGRLAVTGTANTGDRVIAIRYEGVLCGGMATLATTEVAQ
jgi:hypothetical protein